MKWQWARGGHGDREEIWMGWQWGQEWIQDSNGRWVVMKMGWAWDGNGYEVKRRMGWQHGDNGNGAAEGDNGDGVALAMGWK